MSSSRLRSTLHHSVPKPASRPAPLWQAAASLKPADQRREEAPAAPMPTRRRVAEPVASSFAHQTAVLHARDADDRRRLVLATVVVCTGVFVAGIALWQARHTREVYVPIAVGSAAPAATLAAPVALRAEYVAPSAYAEFTPSTRRAPIAVEGVVGGNPNGVAPRVPGAAPAMPLTWTPPPAFVAPTPIDYGARDRRVAVLRDQIEKIDENIRGVRADPHWYGMIKGSTDTSRQQASDGYLAELDRRRNELRREKWALEGR